VLHVDTGREWRGGQTQLLHLVRHQQGPRAVVLPKGAPLVEPLAAMGVATCEVDFKGRLVGGGSLATAIADFGPDLVAAHTSHAHAHAVRVATCPVVVHRRLDFKPSAFSRRMYRQAAAYVAVSGAVREVLLRAGVPPCRVEVVYDGVDATPILAASPVDVRAELGLSSQEHVVLAAGALVDHKAHVHAVHAMGFLPDDVHLVIAGDGARRAEIVSHIEARALQKRVHLLGQRNDVAGLMAGADLFCHPSTEEGLGQVVIEALLAGLPVVATEAGGVPEVVGDLGRLVGVGRPRDLADALRASLADLDAERRRVVAARRQLRQRFSVGTMVEGTERVYRMALDAAAI